MPKILVYKQSYATISSQVFICKKKKGQLIKQYFFCNVKEDRIKFSTLQEFQSQQGLKNIWTNPEFWCVSTTAVAVQLQNVWQVACRNKISRETLPSSLWEIAAFLFPPYEKPFCGKQTQCGNKESSCAHVSIYVFINYFIKVSKS